MATVAGAEREDDGQAAKIAATFSSAASLILSFSASLQPLQLQQLLTNKVDWELVGGSAYLLPLYTFPPFRPNMAAGQLRQGNIWALYRETIPKWPFYEIHS